MDALDLSRVRAALGSSHVRFGCVLALAFALRVAVLGSNPVEVHADELAGLVGVSNIVHGRAPLVPFFDLRIEYLPLYGMFESLSTALLGTSAFAMRLPAALLGVVSVVALRSLVVELTESLALADGAAALFALLPWSIHLSRLGWENAAVFPFLLGGLAALARGLRLRRARPIFLAGALLGIGAYSYRAEPLDAALLAGALMLAYRRRLRALALALTGGTLLAATLVTPLAVAVADNPHFFWRDANIATFGHGYTPAAVATFVRNYIAHFAPGPLFSYGDGIFEHGPHYGELYWWMLPFILVGLAQAPRIVGNRAALVVYAWLAIYPLGGALTNDGVPDFPRTMIGAPLACILTAIGLRAAWLLLGTLETIQRRRGAAQPLPAQHREPQRHNAVRGRTYAALVVGAIALAGLADFVRVYFTVYPAQAADEFKYGTANLFARVRALAPGERRVCFGSLDWYNYETFVDYYLRDSPLDSVEGLGGVCRSPGSLIVVDSPSKAPSRAELVAVQPNYEGAIMAYIYRT